MHRQTAADRLFERSLLGMLMSGFLALASTGELAPLTLGLCAAGFTARLLLLVFQRSLPIAPVWINVLVLLYAGFYPLDIFYLSSDFLGATIRMICFVTVVKGLTFRTSRDALYAIMASFTQLLAAALLSSSLLFFVFLAVYLFCGVATFSTWEVRRGARGARLAVHASMNGFHRRLVSISLAASIGILFFTAGLFFILPRTARAALQNLVSQRFHLPGFGGKVDLRRIGEIQQSSRTVMFVRIADQGDVLPFHWRGSAMSRFDGRQWTTDGDMAQEVRLRYGSANLPGGFHAGRNGTRHQYEVQLAETGMNALFVAGIPEAIQANVGLLAVLSNGSLRVLSEMPSVLRYSVHGFFDAYGGDGTPLLSRDERRRLLAVPAGFDPRIIELAQQAAGSENNPALQSARIAEYLQRSYGYTLALPEEEQADPIAHFLFERRKGHCEYFASSMALMLRAIGIPSRVVTGFQGGTRNPVSGWYTVKASDAHSWVEAFIPGNGWTAFDPTPAAARSAGLPILTRFTQLMEAADLFWQDWIIQYDLDRQFRLASEFEHSQLGSRGQSMLRAFDGVGAMAASLADWCWRHGGLLISLTLAIAAAWLIVPHIRRRMAEQSRRGRLAAGRAAPTDATLLYRRMLALLEKHGLHKPAWFTPLEFADKLPSSELSKQVADFTHAYHGLRYGDDAQAAARMLSLYDGIRSTLLHHSATEPSS